MEVAVYVRKTAGGQFRARTSEPFPAWADAGTQSDAVESPRQQLEDGPRDGPTVVRLYVGIPGPTRPLPDDEMTRAWVEELKRTRTNPDPWDRLEAESP